MNTPKSELGSKPEWSPNCQAKPPVEIQIFEPEHAQSEQGFMWAASHGLEFCGAQVAHQCHIRANREIIIIIIDPTVYLDKNKVTLTHVEALVLFASQLLVLAPAHIWVLLKLLWFFFLFFFWLLFMRFKLLTRGLKPLICFRSMPTTPFLWYLWLDCTSPNELISFNIFRFSLCH